MLNSLKASIKDTFIFGFGNVAVKLIGLILIPLYTDPKYFSIDDFGIIGMLDISGMVLIALITSSIPQSLTRWYWAKDQKENQKSIFFMSFISQLVLSLFFCFILIPLASPLSIVLFKNTNWEAAIILIIISSALQSVNNIVNSLLRLQTRSMTFMVTNLAKLVIVLLLTIYFIVFRKMGVEGIYLAQVFGNALIILTLLPYTFRNITPRFDLATWKPMISYGIPLAIASVATVMLNVVDRYALNSIALLKYVAVYTLAVKISSTLKLVVVDTIKLAVFPQMIKRVDSEENKTFYPHVMLYSSFVVMFGIVGVSLFSLEAIKLLSKTPELWTASMLIPLLSVSMFFVNMREISIYGLVAAKKTGRISLIVFISALLNIILNILLVPSWNATGSALASLLSQFFYWYLLHFIAQKTYFVPYENKRLLTVFILGSLLSFSGLLLTEIDLLPRLAIKFLLLLSFPVLLYFVGFYKESEIRVFKGFVSKWSNLRKIRENLRSFKDIKDDVFVE
ncbi:MAG TPA: polysaccharide biosynthesis C-terminal domain-containing protein [Bacteroidales bacterium]|nr:polysaccharide biosynthesis C-terminal domain-containing protein [Bacteroidales bacterium]